MFNRFLASIGIGAATIDTLLDHDRLMPGEDVSGIVRIRGGNVRQSIDTISLAVMTEYLREMNDSKVRQTCEIARVHVSDPFSLDAGEQLEIPFSFSLPLQTPLTLGRTPVWIKTELEVRSGIDPGDHDRIEVVPTPQMDTVLHALDLLGFRLVKVDCEHVRSGWGRLPFVQEFEFKPAAHFRGKLDELELIFNPAAGGLELLLQIDRRARGLGSLFAEALDMDESYVRCHFSDGQLAAGPEALSRELGGIISRYC